MQYAIAGWPVAGCPSESLLERITRKLRDGWKRLIDILNQPESQKWIKHLWLSRLNSLSPLLLAMKRCFVRPSTLIKMDINTETEIKQKHSLTPSCFPNQPGISRAIFSQLFQEFSHERLLHSGSS